MSVRRLAPPEMQPKEFSFSRDNLAWAKKEITKYPEGRQASAIIPLLWRAQEQSGGWLPEAAIRHVADFQIEIERHPVVHAQFDVLAHRALETLQLA